jgi:hypothetical protein
MVNSTRRFKHFDTGIMALTVVQLLATLRRVIHDMTVLTGLVGLDIID